MRIAIALLATCGALAAQPRDTYRVLVSTDLGGDPDDIQSLYRLVHYSDILRVEGIVSSPGPGAENSVDKVKDWIRRIDPDYLRAKGHPELMTEKHLLGVTVQGAFAPGAPAKDRATEGSKLIVERARAADPDGKGRCLWVQAWGSLTDVAQALHDDPSIAKRIRIYSIGANNTRADEASRQYILDGLQTKWPELWWIENGIYPNGSHDTFRGVYLGGDQTGEWHAAEFVKANIRGRGSNHNGDYELISGDAFPLAGGRPGRILKEGDSPAMLYLLSPALGGPGHIDDPTRESWGGQFRRFNIAKFPNYCVDLDVPKEDNWQTVSKWRVAFLSDWKKRWEWYGPQKPR